MPGFSGNLASTCLPGQETDCHQIRLHLLLPKGADQFSAHAFSVSAEIKGLNGTSFANRHPCAHTSQDIPTGGCGAQTHTVAWVQARPGAFPKSWHPQNCRPPRPTRLATRSFKPKVNPNWDSTSNLTLCPRLQSGLRGVLPTTPDVSLFFPKCLLFELDPSIPHSLSLSAFIAHRVFA